MSFSGLNIESRLLIQITSGVVGNLRCAPGPEGADACFSQDQP
jgi:hypothetical protein